MAQQTPKEKAIDLFDKYFDEMLSLGFHLSNRQICKIALIAVDEIHNLLKIDLTRDSATDEVVMYASSRILYWEEVKQEIEKL